MSTVISLAGQDPEKSVGKPTIRERRKKENSLSVEVYNYPRRCLPRVVDKPLVSADIEQEASPKPPMLLDGDSGEESEESDKIVPPRTGVPLMMRGKGVQVYRFWLAREALHNNVMRLPHILIRDSTTLTDMPMEMLIKIFKELESPSQICLALANKSLAMASRYLNNGYGVYYSRGDRMRVLWRLSAWMGDNRKLCYPCERYFSTSPGMWIERRRSGRSKTINAIYGRIPEDFKFGEGDCPECAAHKTWKRVNTATMKLQSVMT